MAKDTAQIVEKISKAVGLDEAALRGVMEQHRDKVTASGAGWHGPDDIQTLEGLAGSYMWFDNPLVPAVINFTFDAGSVGSAGSYTLTRYGMLVESGTFACVPNNPAIGWAFVLLEPSVGAARSYNFNGMFTYPGWTIQIALMASVGPKGPVLPGFSMLRLPGI